MCQVARPYLPRIADDELTARLSSSGAVLIEGPKACGKTATATQVARSVVRLDVDAGARALVAAAPELLLGQRAPLLLDEWQIEPALWDLVRREVDDRSPARGQFILTGSATPNDDVRRHSGAGRIATLRMRPMSLYEAGHSDGAVSLRDLFDGTSPAALDPGINVGQLLEHIVIGGWPDLLGASVTDARQWLRDYLRNLVEIDVQNLGVRRDPSNVGKLLTALGRSVGTETTVQSLATDVGGAAGPADRDTVDAYLTDVDPTDGDRGRPRVGTTHALAHTAAQIADPLHRRSVPRQSPPSASGPQQLLADLNATGLHFEGLVVRDLRVYTQPLGGRLHHWRDNNGHEVDTIVTLEDGRWAAFEVKMSPGAVDAAADSLLRFAAKVDTSTVGDPSAPPSSPPARPPTAVPTACSCSPWPRSAPDPPGPAAPAYDVHDPRRARSRHQDQPPPRLRRAAAGHARLRARGRPFRSTHPADPVHRRPGPRRAGPRHG